jgi:hypothetical protein
LLLEEGDREGAIAQYRTVLASHPDIAAARHGLDEALAARGRK